MGVPSPDGVRPYRPIVEPKSRHRGEWLPDPGGPTIRRPVTVRARLPVEDTRLIVDTHQHMRGVAMSLRRPSFSGGRTGLAASLAFRGASVDRQCDRVTGAS